MAWLWDDDRGQLYRDIAVILGVLALSGYLWYERVGGEGAVRDGIAHWIAWGAMVMSGTR